MRIQQNYARFTGLTGIVFICTMGMLLSGCGRKMFPKPGGQEAAPQVHDFQAQVIPRGVELSWAIPEGAQAKGVRYSVLRSELNWDNRNCVECPGVNQQEVFRTDAAAAPQAVSSSDRKFHWIDTNIVPNHAYRYQVSLTDANGTPLSTAGPALAKTYPGPVAPTGVAAITQPQGILLQWKSVPKDAEGRNLQGELSFRIDRLIPNKDWEKASPVLIKGNSFLDQGVASEQNYSYRVVPVLQFENTTILGEPSAAVIARAPASVAPPPPNSVWVMPAKGVLEIRWTESDGKVSGYHVYRKEGKEIIRLTASPVQHPPFVDQAAKRNANYFYAVSAVSAQQGNKEGLLSKWAEFRNVQTE